APPEAVGQAGGGRGRSALPAALTLRVEVLEQLAFWWRRAAGGRRRPARPPQRPAAARRIAAPMPSRSHNRSSVHAPPSQREATISTSPPPAAAAACSGVSYREIDATSRARAARSTWSARPKLWITLPTEFPVCCR